MIKNTNQTKISWKTVLVTAGAYVSYIIGSGFASGQEVLQFFGSWGGFCSLIVPLITTVMVILYCTSGYIAGSTMHFDKPSDAYEFYCGKYVAKFMDIFSMIMIAGIGIVMFAGCGAAINQYLGVPVYVGAVFLGIISVIVVCLGLDKVTAVLGYAGIIIIGFIVIVGIATMFEMGLNVGETQKHILEYVAAGKVLQAGVFNYYNPVASGIFYAGNTLCTAFPFIVSLGSGMKSKKEATASAVLSGLLLMIGIFFVLYIVLMNLDYIVSTDAQILTIVSVERVLPVLKLPFTLIIICGIFTTITGYLWLIGRRFAQDGTNKQRIIVIITALIGIFAGSVLPFSKLINILYPFAGIVGVILFIIIVINMLRRKKENVSTENQ